MKKCRECNQTKLLSEFYSAPGMKDGHRSECKACNLAAQAARHRANPEENRERVRLWKEANPKRDAARRALYTSSGQKALWNRKSYLKRKFGLTLEAYDDMLKSQAGVCAICGRPPRPDISLHVDHDHETGDIRGLLDFRCNNALGGFGHDPYRLRAAANYLEKFRRDTEEEAALQERLAGLKRLRDAG